MVTSGNSSSRSAKHFADGQIRAVGHRSPVGLLEEDEAELADLQLVALVQDDGLVDALLVDVGAVQRAGVADQVAVGRCERSRRGGATR